MSQRPDPVDEIEAETARTLHGEEIGEQRAVEHVDRDRAAGDVAPAHAVIARQQPGCSDIAAAPMRFHHQFADGRGIAQAKVQALRADRRDHMRGFADQHDAARRKRLGGLGAEREHPAPGLHRDLAEDRMRAPFELGRERIVIERREPLGLRRLDHADDARTRARQRHQRERSAFGVELGRDVTMRPVMPDVEGERRLRIAAARRFDPGRGAAQRIGAVGADDEPRRDQIAVVEPDDDAILGGLDRGRARIDAPQGRKGGRAALQRGDQMPVLDVVAECRKPDLARREGHLRRADQPRGVVDQADRRKRRRLRGAERPDAQCVERGDRA